MTTEIPKYKAIVFKTKCGELVTAVKNDDRVYVESDKGSSGIVSLSRFKNFYAENKVDAERTPQKDVYIASGRAKKDKELMRALFYSNPFVNPFGYIPTKNGLEPTVKNPVIESLLSTLYDR